jgi:hypothetical protein
MKQLAGGFTSLINKPFLKIEILFAILVGSASAIILRNSITPLIFGGKSFTARSFGVQIMITCAYILCSSLTWFLLIKLLGVLFPKQKQKLEFQFDRWNDYLLKDGLKRLILAFIIMGVGLFAIFMVINIISRINTETWQYENPKIIHTINPIGIDFRNGLYTPAEYLLKSGFRSIGPDGTYPSNYPPLVSLISIPYLLFDANTAYLIHVGLLIVANIISLVLSVLIVKKIIFSDLELERSVVWVSIIFIFFMMAFYHFSSYPFAFSMERGNVDAFALLFYTLAIWILIIQPDKIWLQVILLSIAVHYKIYPAALFIVLLYKHGKKLILPVILVNSIFLLILGPKMILLFLQGITSGSGLGLGIGNRWTWIGNHSAYAFADSLTKYYPTLSSYLIVLWGIFTLLPAGLWIMSVLKVSGNKYSVQNVTLIAMVTIPLMNLIPTVSMDYTLVILSPAALLLFVVIIKKCLQRHNWLDYLQLVLLMIILLLIGRPYEMSQFNPSSLKETSSYFVNNKYLWILALEGLMVFNIFKIESTDMDGTTTSTSINQMS